MFYRIKPGAGQFGTKVIAPDGRALPDPVNVRWEHRAGELPKIIVEFFTDQVDELRAIDDETTLVPRSDPEDS